MKIFWMERATTGIEYRSVFIIKLNDLVVEIDLVERNVKYWKPNEILSDRQLIRNSAVRVKTNEERRKVVSKYFEFS